MPCEWVVIHRLKNERPKNRRERCCKPAGLRVLTAYNGSQRVWLCRVHWKLMTARSVKGKESVDNGRLPLQDV